MNRRDRIHAWTRPSVRDLEPYYKAPLDGDPLRLDQNTNLWGANPAIDSVASPPADQYPTRDSDDLLAALATTHSLTPDHFVIGNGSDEILDLLTKTFTAPGQTLASPTPSYSLYPFYAKLQELRHVQVPLRDGFALDVDGLVATGAALTVVASPNNPTGNAFDGEDLEALVERTDGVVVIDEAYGEYLDPHRSFLHRVAEYDNLAVMRTFSKAYGLAGLRIGYLAGNPDLVERLRLVKPPFNLNVHSEAVAVAACMNSGWMHDVVDRTTAERDRFTNLLRDAGFSPYPSDANFILAGAPQPAHQILEGLRDQGILARGFPNVKGLENAVRFTVGRPEHTDQLMAALEALP